MNTTKRTLCLQGILCLLLLLSLFSIASTPVNAQGLSITYVGQAVTCSSIAVTYTISGASTPPGSVLVEAIVNGSPLANNDGPATDGTHTVTLTFATQPAGTMIFGRVSDGFSTEQGAPEACEGGGPTPTVPAPTATLPGPTPPAPPATIVSVPPSNNQPWAGVDDGRQNPDLAECYSVWCNYDRIDVYRSVPETELIKMIPLGDVNNLSVGSIMDLGDFMTLVRNTEDTVTIYGSNGNHAPEPGEKAFSLEACITSNGGAPEDSSSSSESNPANPVCSDPDTFLTYLDVCLAALGYNSLGIFLAQIWLFCMGQLLGPFGLIISGYFVLRKRRET